jgi:hypothetical protein
VKGKEGWNGSNHADYITALSGRWVSVPSKWYGNLFASSEFIQHRSEGKV